MQKGGNVFNLLCGEIRESGHAAIRAASLQKRSELPTVFVTQDQKGSAKVRTSTRTARVRSMTKAATTAKQCVTTVYDALIELKPSGTSACLRAIWLLSHTQYRGTKSDCR
jgi:hypothetical protein